MEFKCDSSPRTDLLQVLTLGEVISVLNTSTDVGTRKGVSVHLTPSDARKFAAELIRLADEIEPEVVEEKAVEEPAPKFKAGDRVVWNGGDDWCAGLVEGCVYTVLSICMSLSNPYAKIKSDFDEWDRGVPFASLDPAPTFTDAEYSTALLENAWFDEAHSARGFFEYMRPAARSLEVSLEAARNERIAKLEDRMAMLERCMSAPVIDPGHNPTYTVVDAYSRWPIPGSAADVQPHWAPRW